jgi:putative ABC transport system ATP-binding protein
MKNVVKIYGKGRAATRALDGIDLEVMNGSIVTIMGPSGCGKSTLLHLIGAQDTPTSGEVIVDRVDVTTLPESKAPRFRRHTVGFIFQDFYLLRDLRVIDNVLMPLIPYGIKPVDRQRALDLIEAVGLSQVQRQRARELSGGQSQRVAIARALINNPKIILADEPTGNLDSGTGKSIIHLLMSIVDETRTLIIVTHDPRISSVVERDPRGRNIYMEDGRIVDRMPIEESWCT